MGSDSGITSRGWCIHLSLTSKTFVWSNWYLRRALYRISCFTDDLNVCRDRHIFRSHFTIFIACILRCFKMLYSTAPMLLYNSDRPLNAGNERVYSLSGNSLSCLYWSSVMPSTMPDPSDPGVTTSISLISRHAVFGFFQYEKGRKLCRLDSGTG